MRLPYLALTSMFTLIRLLPMSDQDFKRRSGHRHPIEQRPEVCRRQPTDGEAVLANRDVALVSLPGRFRA